MMWWQAQHALVARWTKSIDLFGKKMVLVPVNEALHWCVRYTFVHAYLH